MPELIGDRDPARPLGAPGPQQALSWLIARQRWVLMATVAFQLVVLGSMVVGKTALLWSSDVILLRVVPVDPRDLFRGDYVTLGYEVGQVPPEGIQGLPGPLARSELTQWEGKTVYVSLLREPDGQHYKSLGVSTTRPGVGPKFLQGRLNAMGRISFGIESYFVQEGKGKAYEQAVREHRLSAEVALAPDGRATLVGLRIEPSAP